jgi:ketopantoate reductase
MVKVTVTWTNNNPDTIWNKLATKLGREPTTAEAEAEVKRILKESK